MSDKSNKYGYVGVDIPEQSFGSNKGVFNPAEINELVADNKWTQFGQLELIETQNITTTTANVDFTDLGNYNVHFLTYNNAETDTDTKTVFIRLSNDSGSSFISSGYQYANQIGNSNGTFLEVNNTSAIGMSFSNAYGTGSNERGNGYVYLYNLLDSSKYSFATSHHTMFDQNPYYRFGFGSAVLPTAETHNAIRLTQSLGNIATLDVSLYGIRYS